MTRTIPFAAMAALAVVLAFPAAGWAQVTASCSAFRTDLTRVEGEPGAISLTLGYQNASGASVTYTTTTNDNIFTGAGSSTITVASGVGVVQQPALQTSFFAPGKDTVIYTITSSATGSTVLATCQFTVTILDATADTDGDGLFDAWETGGVDVDLDGTVDLTLPGANSQRADLYLEIDCLAAADHSHCPRQLSIQDVVQAFANAPVANPDGTTGVQLHVDTGSLYGAGIVTAVPGAGGVTGTYGDLGGGNSIAEAGNEIIDFDGASGDPATSLYDLKAANFAAGREFVYRYTIFGHQTNARRPANDCTSGWAEGIPGGDFMVTLGGGTGGTSCWGNDAAGFSTGSRAQQAGTLMHEFGHTLGLGHGGGDGVNRKPNYLSLMSYAFQMCSVPASPAGILPGGCDFSSIALPPLNETSLDECAGIGGGLGFGPMDWNASGLLTGATCAPASANVQVDVNGDDRCVGPGDDGVLDSITANDDVVNGTRIEDGFDLVCDSTAVNDDTQDKSVGNPQPNPLVGFDDWSNLFYAFRTLGNFADGISSPTDEEADPVLLEEAKQDLLEIAAPQIAVTKSGPATGLPGEVLTYQISAANSGGGPALQTVALDTRPDGTEVALDLGAVKAGTTQSGTVTYTIPSNACPMTLVNMVEVTFADLVGGQHTTTAAASTEVLDVTPPVVTVGPPIVLWPPDHGLATFSLSSCVVSAVDECDGPLDVDAIGQVVSISSDEPEKGKGDGSTMGDIAILGNSSFAVRRERQGGGNGRVYTVTFEVSDTSGNAAVASCRFEVPHNRNRPAVDDGPGGGYTVTP
jgi:uncharacterized repeat protein (TIGR01451 family)